MQRSKLMHDGAMVKSSSYPAPLPPELNRWHLYVADGGHSIMAILHEHYESNRDNPLAAMIPIPVKTVIRQGYEVKDGRIVVNPGLNYSDELGLQVPEEDAEYESA
ncbi:MAG TPA: hypothetical protein V6D29_11180 [Leptolyngbyaceae cyanobacterium]